MVGFDHRRTRNISIQITTGFELNLPIKPAPASKVLTLNRDVYPQVPKTLNSRCVDLDCRMGEGAFL
jgi:hypothetical protein